jgi:HSP20 family protein
MWMRGHTGWLPFGLHREMGLGFGRFFGDAWQQSPYDHSNGTPTWWPAAERFRANGTLWIRLALPGVNPKDVEISVADQTLSVKGSRQATGECRPAHYFRRELACGSFERTFAIPKGTDAAQVQATYVNGMLEITTPAPQLAAPKKIEIQLDGQAPARKQMTA